MESPKISPSELFILSEEALTKVVDQIMDDMWQKKVPSEIQKDEPNLRTLINYHAFDDAWVPDVLAGKTATEVGKKYEGDLLGENPKKSWHEIVDKAIAAAKNFHDFDKTTHLSYGDFPAHEYLHHITLFRTFRAVDLARFLGFDDALEPDLVQGVWDYLVPVAEDLRKMGVLGTKIDVPEDAPLQVRLLGLSGRQP